uniref:Uncharacterized protein n=1 Tax=uncultured marine group II/III euryarchaeote AD1000_44_A09 TaxID=1457774 RepID=A0A075FS52_9EURY|nr:hypothetical protein [uncultured marine group II/III euryarchaeote AD1000_44_A09]
MDNSNKQATASTAFCSPNLPKSADRMLIRGEVALSEPLERSGHTINQTYGLSRLSLLPTYLQRRSLIRCAYTRGAGRRFARTSPLEAQPMRDGRVNLPFLRLNSERSGNWRKRKCTVL